MNSFDVVEHNQVKVGDILVGADGNTWRNGPYEIIDISWSRVIETRVRIKNPRGEKIYHILYNYHKYRVAIKMMQYDPTQQGDTDEDI